MAGFAIVIGTCKIVPASPQLAVLLVMWMYGAAPGMPYDAYRQAYLADGATPQQVAQVERCFREWRP